ncbi:MAG: hypothetical protein FVQ81_01060 [Candidatus Glassbacteria bacterium]|nr:hypothetical protein [Candidatus Glassbacteria bacterium]
MNASGSHREGRPIRVAVAGGGPAGTFFAYCLLKEAARRGRAVEVTIFEPKTFERRGASHCNYCQGVISDGLLGEMKKLGLWIPEQVIRARIKSYSLVTLGGEVRLPVPDGQHVFTVFRGHGPVEESEGAISFDQFLLDKAVQCGVVKKALRIDRVTIVPGSDNPVTIIDYHGGIHQADMIIGAYGVNSDLGEQFEELGFGYRRPATDSALQAEFRYGSDVDGKPGQEIRIFALGLPQIRFAVVTPKRSHATVSLIGEHLGSRHMERFLAHSQVAGRLSSRAGGKCSMRCSCAPLMPIGDGGTLAAAHCLIIGDAAVSRYYKNGIESALRSAEIAAGVLVEHGPSNGAALERHYSRRVKRIFGTDNFLGRVLFDLHDRIYRIRSVAAGYLAIARGDFGITGHSRRKLRWILWNMFTGDATYSRIFLNCLDPILLARIVVVSLKMRLFTGTMERDRDADENDR